jgi:hypothetical protein
MGIEGLKDWGFEGWRVQGFKIGDVSDGLILTARF